MRVDPHGAPTYLCADDGAARRLYAGTLSHAIVFLGAHVRLNVGLSSAEITVDGRGVRLTESPAGLDVVAGHAARPLALG